ncbi:MAG: DegT/DnrJ/EryC1/StrS family aminotransferase [Bradyrhizobium sp.]
MSSPTAPRISRTKTDTVAEAPVPLNDVKRQYETLGEQINAAIRRVAASGRYVFGPCTAAFEGAFADYCGTRHCVGLANGTDALEIALRAVGCGPGDDVVTTPNSGMYATAAILAAGARPVLADIEPQQMTMAPASLAAVLGTRVKAVIVTHLYGRLADMDRISAVTRGTRIALIEDCAQAHGAERGNRKAGSFGAIGCFSFYPTKNLGALGDGGAIVTNDHGLAEAARELAQYGWRSKYRAVRPGGRNSRLDEIQAAVLTLKLAHLDGWNAKRRDIVRRYSAALGAAAMLLPKSGDDAAHLCVLRSKNRAELREHLARDGIENEVHYPIPDHRQPALQSVFAGAPALPHAERAADEVLTIPCFPELTDGEVERVCESLARFSERERQR